MPEGLEHGILGLLCYGGLCSRGTWGRDTDPLFRGKSKQVCLLLPGGPHTPCFVSLEVVRHPWDSEDTRRCHHRAIHVDGIVQNENI